MPTTRQRQGAPTTPALPRKPPAPAASQPRAAIAQALTTLQAATAQNT